jgi:hypothetical protein
VQPKKPASSNLKGPEEKERKPALADLRAAEAGLIEAIRSIKDGEIELIKIQDGLPVYFKVKLQAELFDID